MNKILIAAIALLASNMANAGNWYLGFGLGAARSDDVSNNVSAGTSKLAQNGITNITSSEDHSSTMSIFVGYNYNDYLATEIGYHDLGSYRVRGYTGPGTTPPSGWERNDADALSFSAVLTAPLSQQFAMYAKLGPTIASNESWTCLSTDWWCDHTTDTKIGAMTGLGTWFTFPQLIGAFRIDLSRFNNVGSNTNEVTAGSFTTLQFQYVYSFDY